MKKNSKFSLRIFCCILALVSLHCGRGNGEAPVTTGKDDGAIDKSKDKASLGLPPQFDPAQLKVGNFIEWSRTNAQGNQGCVKWTITKIWTDLAQIKRHESVDCQVYHDEFYELIEFRFEDGLVLSHDYVLRGSIKPAPTDVSLYEKHAKLFDHFYKNPSKVLFSIGTESFGGKSLFPVFRLNNGDQIYYKGNDLDPIHPWHAVIIKFKDTANPPNNYLYHSARPSLIVTPK